MEQNYHSTRTFRLAVVMMLIYLTSSTILQWFFIFQYQLSTPPKGFYNGQFEAVAKVFRYILIQIKILTFRYW